MPVQQKNNQQQHGVDDDIQRAKIQRHHIVQSVAQALEGIHAKGALLEQPHADAANGNAKNGHQRAAALQTRAEVGFEKGQQFVHHPISSFVGASSQRLYPLPSRKARSKLAKKPEIL